ncbi:hypothetical protein BRARA_A02444 [Brassica rapa]|uniref:Uncharacterized protein n=1 Tax=Brassica campestris TaxID=3711 RepID=A0A398AVS1_BRACM|nr:hypothetical protein BRARA_A02444 [Brassica rapa]
MNSIKISTLNPPAGVCSFGRTQRERLRTEICELTRMKFKSSLNLSLKLKTKGNGFGMCV